MRTMDEIRSTLLYTRISMEIWKRLELPASVRDMVVLALQDNADMVKAIDEKDAEIAQLRVQACVGPWRCKPLFDCGLWTEFVRPRFRVVSGEECDDD